MGAARYARPEGREDRVNLVHHRFNVKAYRHHAGRERERSRTKGSKYTLSRITTPSDDCIGGRRGTLRPASLSRIVVCYCGGDDRSVMATILDENLPCLATATNRACNVDPRDVGLEGGRVVLRDKSLRVE